MVIKKVVNGQQTDTWVCTHTDGPCRLCVQPKVNEGRLYIRMSYGEFQICTRSLMPHFFNFQDCTLAILVLTQLF